MLIGLSLFCELYATIPMQVLLLYSNFIVWTPQFVKPHAWESGTKTVPMYSGWTCYNSKRGTSIPPTGICLSPVYTLTQHRWPECPCPCAGRCETRFSDDLWLHLAIALGLQLFPYYAQHYRRKPKCCALPDTHGTGVSRMQAYTVTIL